MSEEQLLTAIQELHEGARLDVHRDDQTQRLTGHIISASFANASQDERQVELWKWLWACFGFDATEIGKLDLLTGEEYEALPQAR